VTAVGQPLARVEDEPLVTGSGCYVGDVTRDGQLWARVARSPVAHGRLVGLELGAARAHPGVVAAVCAADIPGIESLRIPCRLHPPPQAERVTQPPLALDRVRYVGEPLAVVVAADPYVAEDAAAAIVTEIEELPAVLDPVAATGSGATVLHPGLGHNTAGSIVCRHGEGVDELFRDADAVVSERLIMHRHSAVPMETRGLVAELGDDGRLTVWGPTKVKHHNRALLAELLDMDERRIRFIEPDVGGSFGTRGEFYPEDFLIPWLALRLGRPVKWIEDRTENFLASNHSRERFYEIEMCARSDGTLLALRSSEWCGLGGYLRTAGLTVPEISVRHLAGPYRWEAFQATSYGVLTNKTPIGTYRGPGEAEATFARERMLDLLADELALDPADLRLRNLIRPADLPYRLEFGSGVEPVVHESGDYPSQLQTLLDHVGYEELRDQTAAARSAGELAGLGISCFIGEGSYGPFEWARVVAEPDGSFTGYVGAASFGQGLRTALRQILADALDVPVERVRIHHHDTDLVAEGVGSWADRTTALAGGALLEASRELLRNARRAGATALGIDEDALELAGGEARVRDDGRSLALGDLHCEGTARFERPGMAFSFGTALAVVSLDRDTGAVDVRRYVGAYDAGRVINPLTLHGQLDGAAVQGIAGALFEEFAYDGAGQPLVTSFIDHLMPTCADVPSVESLVVEFPAPDNPLGVKGAGNPGIVGTYAALANAVADALEEEGRNVTRLPLEPVTIQALLEEATISRAARQLTA